MDEHELVVRLGREPARTGLFLDFDGTLSEIVPVPADARPIAGAGDALTVLSARFGAVAVVSGRAAGQLLEWLGPEVEIWGVHGAETVSAGRVVRSPVAQAQVAIMAAALTEARAAVAELGIAGVEVEDKAVVVALHYRAAAERDRAASELDRIAAELARRRGLRRGRGRLVYELHPPIELSKRAVVLERARAAHVQAAAFFGDDLVDLAAFDALDELERDGVGAVRVAVASDETPPELLERADAVVEGPAGVVRVLTRLAQV